jgi:hypothetical protein
MADAMIEAGYDGTRRAPSSHEELFECDEYAISF